MTNVTRREYILERNIKKNIFKSDGETVYINVYFAPLFFGGNSNDLITNATLSYLNPESFKELKNYLYNHPKTVKYQRHYYAPSTVLANLNITPKLLPDYLKIIEIIRKFAERVPLYKLK